MRHDYCPLCDLWNQYAKQCAYTTCPADKDPPTKNAAYMAAQNAAYMYWDLKHNAPDPEEEAARKRYLRHADGGDHYPDDSNA